MAICTMDLIGCRQLWVDIRHLYAYLQYLFQSGTCESSELRLRLEKRHVPWYKCHGVDIGHLYTYLQHLLSIGACESSELSHGIKYHRSSQKKLCEPQIDRCCTNHGINVTVPKDVL